MEAFTVLAVERLAKADRHPGVWGVVVFPTRVDYVASIRGGIAPEELYRTMARQSRQIRRIGNLRRRSGVTDASGPLSSLSRRELRGNNNTLYSVDEPKLIAGHAVCLDGITAIEQSA